MPWSTLATTGPGPTPRHGLACTTLSTNDSTHLYVFGGKAADDTGGVLYQNDLRVLCCDTLEWKEILNRTDGPWPRGRAFHSATAIDSRAFLVFGGAAADASARGGSSARTTAQTQKQKRPSPTGSTCARAGTRRSPSAATSRSAGASSSSPADVCYMNDVWLFKGDRREWVLVVCGGRSPPPRGAHAAALVPSPPRLLVHGGCGEDQSALDDLWMLTVTPASWSQICPGGAGPCGRCYHTASAVGSKVLVFGGRTDKGLSCDAAMHVLDLSTKGWAPPIVPTARQCPAGSRSSHSAVVCGAAVLLYGGRAEVAKEAAGAGGRADTVLAFDATASAWLLPAFPQLDSHGPGGPSSAAALDIARGSHAAALVSRRGQQPAMLVLCGYAGLGKWPSTSLQLPLGGFLNGLRSPPRDAGRGKARERKQPQKPKAEERQSEPPSPVVLRPGAERPAAPSKGARDPSAASRKRARGSAADAAAAAEEGEEAATLVEGRTLAGQQEMEGGAGPSDDLPAAPLSSVLVASLRTALEEAEARAVRAEAEASLLRSGLASRALAAAEEASRLRVRTEAAEAATEAAVAAARRAEQTAKEMQATAVAMTARLREGEARHQEVYEQAAAVREQLAVAERALGGERAAAERAAAAAAERGAEDKAAAERDKAAAATANHATLAALYADLGVRDARIRALGEALEKATAAAEATRAEMRNEKEAAARVAEAWAEEKAAASEAAARQESALQGCAAEAESLREARAAAEAQLSAATAALDSARSREARLATEVRGLEETVEWHAGEKAQLRAAAAAQARAAEATEAKLARLPAALRGLADRLRDEMAPAVEAGLAGLAAGGGSAGPSRAEEGDRASNLD